MDGWSSKNLGDEMWAWQPLAEIEELFLPAYRQAGSPPEMAVFVRHESAGRLHCEVVAYFSPASLVVAQALDTAPCPKPTANGLSLLVGDETAWPLLFPEQRG